MQHDAKASACCGRLSTAASPWLQRKPNRGTNWTADWATLLAALEAAHGEAYRAANKTTNDATNKTALWATVEAPHTAAHRAAYAAALEAANKWSDKSGQANPGSDCAAHPRAKCCSDAG